MYRIAVADAGQEVPEAALDPLDSAYAFVLRTWQNYWAWWHQEREQAEVLHGYPVVVPAQAWDELWDAVSSLVAWWGENPP